MANQSNPDRQAMNLRLPVDLSSEVKAYAARTHRSVNSALVHLIALGLERESVFGTETAR